MRRKSPSEWQQLLLFCSILPGISGKHFDGMRSPSLAGAGFAASPSLAGKSSSGICPLLRDSAGTEIAEAAFVLPVLFLFLLSIFWFGRAFSMSGSINHAAREGARVAAVPACGSCSPAPGTVWSGSALPGDKSVVDAVNAALIAAHVDPTNAQPYSPNPAPVACEGVVPQGVCVTATGTAPSAEINICRNVVLNQGNQSPPVCGVIVNFQYPYQLVRPFSKQAVVLKAEVEMQGE